MARRTRPALALLVAAGAVAAGTAGRPAGFEGALEVVPSRIEIGLRYDGATVHVAARIPAGHDAAVLVTSGTERLELKEKGKVAGVLWMSVGAVAYENVPVLYRLLTTAPLEVLAPAEVLAAYRIGYSAVVRAEGSSPDRVPELIRLKERDGLWAIDEGGLARRAGGPEAIVAGVFSLPAAVRPGEYAVEVIGFREGRASRLASGAILVERVGLVDVMWSLSAEHALFYGCAAVVIALVAGLLTGLLFQSGRRGAR